MTLHGSQAIERALKAVGERLAADGESVSVVVLGGAAMNLHGIVQRATTDVDILARVVDDEGTIAHPDPLPEALHRAAAAVARDLRLRDDWMNTAVAGQWELGLPEGLADRLEWRMYGALRVGLVSRRDLIYFKLYASADQTGPESVHARDLLALLPTRGELAGAAEWVRAQDASPDFHRVVAEVVEYVDGALR